jgi:DNA-binding transcriptional MerR regulator
MEQEEKEDGSEFVISLSHLRFDAPSAHGSFFYQNASPQNCQAFIHDKSLTFGDLIAYTAIRVQARYPIRAVAKITGLSLDTLRAWERRYSAVVPERSERGRQYGPEHIERLLLLSRLVQKGHAIGRIAQLSDSELQALLTREPSRPLAPPALSDNLIAPVLAAIDEYDSARASDELSRLAALLPPRDLVYNIALPLMRETGDRWHRGDFTIGQEHLVSQILRNLLGSMIRHLRPLGAVPKIVLATLAGESHDFGILAAAMLASLSGLEPVYLGPDIPASDIVQAAKRTSARIVSIGITLPSSTTARDLQALADELPEGVELWIGGSGSDSTGLSELPGRAVHLKELTAFETECLRGRK